MAAKSETGFIMLKHWDEQISMLSIEQKGILLEAIYKFQCLGEDFKTEDGMLQMLWSTLRQTFEHNNKKYEKLCEINRIKAKKRWETDAAVCSGMPTDADDADIDIEIEKDKEKEIDIEIEKEEEKEIEQPAAADLTEEELRKKHMKEYDFSGYSGYDLTRKLAYTKAGAAGFTIAEADMLGKLIFPLALKEYMLKINNYDVNDRFTTIINWAKEDGNYHGMKYELRG